MITDTYFDISFDKNNKIYYPIERRGMIDPNNPYYHIIHTVNGLRIISLDIAQWDTVGHIGIGLAEYQMKIAKENYDRMGFVVFEYKKYCQEFCDWLNEYMKERR